MHRPATSGCNCNALARNLRPRRGLRYSGLDRHEEGCRINHDDPAVQFQECRRLAGQVGLPEGRTGVNRKAKGWEDRDIHGGVGMTSKNLRNRESASAFKERRSFIGAIATLGAGLAGSVILPPTALARPTPD